VRRAGNRGWEARARPGPGRGARALPGGKRTLSPMPGVGVPSLGAGTASPLQPSSPSLLLHGQETSPQGAAPSCARTRGARRATFAAIVIITIITVSRRRGIGRGERDGEGRCHQPEGDAKGCWCPQPPRPRAGTVPSLGRASSLPSHTQPVPAAGVAGGGPWGDGQAGGAPAKS